MLRPGDELRRQDRWARRFVVVAVTLLAAGFVWWNDPERQAQDPSSVKVIVPESESDHHSGQAENSDQTPSSQAQRSEPDSAGSTQNGDSLPAPIEGNSSRDIGPISKKSAASSRESGDVVEIVRDVTIRDLSGRVAFQGDVDLRPTLDRIARGIRHSHDNDGTVFRNFEGRLPKRPSGYYHEFVHPTPGLTGPGPQRVVTGREGDVYYTPDHYQSFRKIR